ncbi:MAG: hypothetical protein ABS69_17650 [Nitrosomonadales bacterium SCN 54-20]|nr:MAG: hypothetical protein ABS69_17650 [Nitrosomonadales bacterium SCN 54-20]
MNRWVTWKSVSKPAASAPRVVAEWRAPTLIRVLGHKSAFPQMIYSRSGLFFRGLAAMSRTSNKPMQAGDTASKSGLLQIMD